jgi:hypothetical protein
VIAGGRFRDIMGGVPKTSGPEQGTLPFADLDDERSALRDEVARLRAENARLLRLLELTPREARPPGPVQTGVFDAAPGPVQADSPAAAKVAFFAALFGARRDVYALRWENAQSGRSGWTPAVRGGWRKGVPAAEREYLPLAEGVITAHLSGELELGLYPLLDGDRCCWLAADFDGATALLDALAYLKAARAAGASAALEVSRSGLGAHVWLFFTAPVSAATARQVGGGLLREAVS